MTRRGRFSVSSASLGVAIIVLTACGSGSAGTTSGAGGSQRPSNTVSGSASVPQKVALPTVDVLDTATGQKVAFAGILPAVRPVLVWFWAPH